MKPYDPQMIRSFSLVGHGGCGKTSIADAIAHLTGLNTRLGSVADGSSLLDYEPEEKERGGSLSDHFLTCEYDSYKIHVADTPGDADFNHDAHLAVQVHDAVVLVVSATDGVETATEKMSALAARLDLPRVIFINKLDRDRADVPALLTELRDVLGVEPVPLQIPIGDGDGFRGLVDLVNRTALTYDGPGGKPTEGPIPAELRAEVDAALEQLVESVAMVDDELVERYLEEGELTQDELRAGLNKGLITGAIVPVLYGSATRNIGVDRLLWLTRAFPSPVGRAPWKGHSPGDAERSIEVRPDPDGPFAALCFKALIDPFMGHLALFRVVRGRATTDTHPKTADGQHDERFGNLFHLVGKKHEPVDAVVPGDIFAVPKLKHTHVGDTLYVGEAVRLAFEPPPPPMISYVLKPVTRTDEDKIRSALEKLLAEDRGLHQTFDPVTKEIVLAGRGANHIHVSTQKMRRKYGVNVEGTPTIPYRETIAGRADVRYRHKKQSGGAGQFGEVSIRVAPNPDGGFEFVDRTVGGVIPHSLIPSVEKGVRWQLDQGVLAGFPLVDVSVGFYDGKSHPVDSKDIAFQIAGRQAIKRAVMMAKPVLLEPLYDVEVVVPEDNVGDIMGDLNTRRARIQKMEGRGRSSVVRAFVPLAEMLNYAPALKSITGGRGNYTMTFHKYDAVPSHMQDKLVEEVNRIIHHDDDHH